MATKAKPRKKAPDILEEVKKGDLDELINHVKAYPIWYVGAVVFLVLCVVVGMTFRSDSGADATAIAKAMATEDPAMRAVELEPIAYENGPRAAEALVLLGHANLAAGNPDEAKAAFERVRSEHSGSQHLSGAVEGLGLVAESQKDYEAAIGYYNEVVEKWPNSIERRRQNLYIGRAQEKLGNYSDAIAAYQAVERDSSAYAQDARDALDRLQKSHPDLFPEMAEEQAPAVPVTPEISIEETPAEEAPAETAAPEPAAEAPAQTTDTAEPEAESPQPQQ